MTDAFASSQAAAIRRDPILGVQILSQCVTVMAQLREVECSWTELMQDEEVLNAINGTQQDDESSASTTHLHNEEDSVV